MPATKNMKRTTRKDFTGAQVATASRKSCSKASGTRVGIIQDWRAASENLARPLAQRGNILRDGR